MHRRRVCCLVLPAALAVPLVLAAPSAARPASAAAPATPAAAPAPVRAGADPAPGGPTLSTGDRLGLRRFVVAGTRAYELGTEDGRYPVMGFHTRGEMGGVWSPPIKLLDGLWFGLDGRWLGPATRFTRGYGYTRMELPDAAGVRISRTDVVPDGRRALLVGLTLSSAAARTVRLTLDAHSELMSVYPWGETTPSQLAANLPDTAAVSAGRLVFRDRGTPPGGLPAHDWAAVVAAAPGSPLRLVGGDTGRDFRGPQEGGPICPASGPGAPPAPDTCKDTAYGRGAGGQLRYELRLPAGRAVTVWFVAAGSDRGLPAALAEAGGAAAPEAALAAKVAARQRLAGATRLTLPGDPRLARSVEWSKQDLADLLQEAHDLRIRETNAGKRYPPPVGTVPRVRFVGAGYPDYPWLFATDGEYTAFALVGLGQFDAAKDHLRALRDVSDVVNRRSGKIVHEVTTDGSVYFGANADPGNTDESVKFPSAVALVWRWTGDDRFRDEMYDSSRRALAYVTRNLDKDGDGWPEGSGNVEREGQGAEKLDNAVYLIRGLYDLAEMADGRGDTATAAASRRQAGDLLRRFERTWWAGSVAPAYADSLRDPGDERLFQRYWTGLTPLEAELPSSPGIARADRAQATLRLHETACFTGPYGLYHTGQGPTTATLDPPQPTFPCDGDRAVSSAPDEKDTFTLNSAVAAVAEGNYGRLAQQRIYTSGNARLQFEPDEMPGAMPEIAPGGPHPPYYGRNLQRLLTERAQVQQAWGAYGTVWPVVHQQLGVAPDLGRGRLAVVPQIPPGQPLVAGRSIRLGAGSVDVAALASTGGFTVVVSRDRVPAALTLGYVLAPGATVRAVTLNGRPVPYRLVRTNRGLEVRVDAGSLARAVLVVRTG